MANLKISALPSATTPLAGTEVLPIVQSSTTDQVTVANLTAGRAVSAASLSLTTTPLAVGSGGTGLSSLTSSGILYATSTSALTTDSTVTYNGNGVFSITNGAIASVVAQSTTAGNNAQFVAKSTIREWRMGTNIYLSDGSYEISDLTAGAYRVSVNTSGDVTVKSGNIVQGTAAKGINFTANTPASGYTSQLLNWYEEGTWTPNQGSGLTVVGTFTSSGYYNRIGRQVYVVGYVNGSVSVAVSSAGLVCSNLPFTAKTGFDCGSATNGATTASSTINVFQAKIYNATAIGASNGYLFSATYIV